MDASSLNPGDRALQEVMAVAWDPLLIVECSGFRIREANPAACRLFGVLRSALLGSDLSTFFSEANSLRDIFAAHRDFIPLRFLKARRSKHVPVELALRYFTGEQGEELVTIALRDISERLERERADKESDRKYKMLFEASPYPILILNVHGMVVDANACAQSCYGYEHQELIRLNWSTFDNSPLATQFSARPTMLAARPHTRRDGSHFIAEVMLTYFRLRGQALILALIRDVTEHWQTFRALEESEARWRFALEGSGDAIIDVSLDPEGRQYISPILSGILGYSAAEDEQLRMEGWMQRVHPEDRPNLEAAMQAHVAGSSPMIRDEHRLREKSGSYRWVSLRAKMMDSGPLERRLIGVVRDIHEGRMRTLQEAVARGRLYRLERMATAGEMLSALAHEVNQPLTAISNYSALSIRQFAQAGSREKIERSLTVINEQAMRAGEIVKRIREFVRRSEPNIAPTSINALISRVVGWCTNELAAANLLVRLEFAIGLPEVEVDIMQIEQVLFNLLRNGIDAMLPATAEPRPLYIGSGSAGNEIQIYVRDEGGGLDESVLPYIFEPFVSSKPDGMGMGLAVCRTIVEAHGGCIRAEANGDGPGARFVISLPLRKSSTNTLEQGVVHAS